MISIPKYIFNKMLYQSLVQKIIVENEEYLVEFHCR